MMRTISNWIDKRKKVFDEKIDFSEVQSILSELKPETKINVNYHKFSVNFKFKDKTPSDISEFIENEFRQRTGYYCFGNHQVFSGNGVERHYLDLKRGDVNVSIGDDKFMDSPDKYVTLDYILKNEGK